VKDVDGVDSDIKSARKSGLEGIKEVLEMGKNPH